MNLTILSLFLTLSVQAAPPAAHHPSFWFLTLMPALAGSHAADGETSIAAQSRGGYEYNSEYGRHPGPGRMALVQGAYFAGETTAFWFTERSHHPAIRWTGRIGIMLVTAWHSKLAFHNSAVCTQKRGCPQYPLGGNR